MWWDLLKTFETYQHMLSLSFPNGNTEKNLSDHRAYLPSLNTPFLCKISLPLVWLLHTLCLSFPLLKSVSSYWVSLYPFRDMRLWCLITGFKFLLCVKRFVRAGGKGILGSAASWCLQHLSLWLSPPPPMLLAAFPPPHCPFTHRGEKSLPPEHWSTVSNPLLEIPFSASLASLLCSVIL